MSSHHFVKEGQEPALLILDDVPLLTIESLLEWVPLIVVADKVLEIVSQWGIKIDVILQQNVGSKEIQKTIEAQTPVRILPCESDIFSQGLSFLIDEKYNAVNVICYPTPEAFQSAEKFGDRIQVAVYTEKEKWLYVKSGRFEKWLPEYTALSFKGSDASFLKMNGLTREGDVWKTSNAGLVFIESKSPFWLKEAHVPAH